MDANDAATLALLAAGGIQPIPADSGAGPVYRPLARGQDGGRLAGPETLYDYFINAVFDPDQALRANPNLVNEIHAHPDVEAAMDKRATTVSQFDETIEANPEGPDKKIAEEIASYVRRAWMAMPNRIHLYWELVYYATLMGGVGHDWVWHREATGLQRPVKFWLVDKSRFVFDRIGNMALRTRTTPVWGTYVAAEQVDQYITKASKIPQGRITYHWFRRRGGQWEQPDLEGYQYFGVGLDIPLGALVTYGFFALRFWMRYIEKFGIPPFKLLHPANMALSPQVKAVAEQIRSESVIALPRFPGVKDGAGPAQWDVEPLEVPTSQFNWFKDTADWITEKVNLICLAQADASGGGEGRTGEGYSGHVSRYDSGPSLVYKSDAKKICEMLDSQIIAPIALNRFPQLPQEYWPKIKLQAKEERDRAQEMDVAEKAASMVPLVEDEVYERSGFRKPEPGEKTIGGQAPESDPFTGKPMPPMGLPGAQGAPKPGKSVPGFGGKPQSAAEGAPPKEAIGQRPQAGGNAVGQKPNKPLKQRTIDRSQTSGPR